MDRNRNLAHENRTNAFLLQSRHKPIHRPLMAADHCLIRSIDIRNPAMFSDANFINRMGCRIGVRFHDMDGTRRIKSHPLQFHGGAMNNPQHILKLHAACRSDRRKLANAMPCNAIRYALQRKAAPFLNSANRSHADKKQGRKRISNAVKLIASCPNSSQQIIVIFFSPDAPRQLIKRPNARKPVRQPRPHPSALAPKAGKNPGCSKKDAS